MSNLRELLVHSGQYLAGRAGLMVLGFLSFPVLTRLLPVAQYGELSLALKLCLLWTVLSKCGIQNAALRFFPEYSKGSPEAKRACASTLVGTVAIFSIALTLVGLLILHFSHLHTIAAVAALAPLLFGLSFVRSIQPTFSGLLRSERRTWLFNACELSGKAMGIMCAIAALTLIAINLRYYLSGLLIAESIVVGAVAVWFYRNNLLSFRSFDPSFARSALTFSFPLIAYELTSVILDSGDRILIGKYLGLTQLGFYAAAYSIATYAEEALMTPVNMALLPTYMKIWVNEGEHATSEFLSKALDIFVMGCGVIATLVYVNSPDLLAILASRKFAEASVLLPILVVGLLIYALHIFFNAPLIIHKRSVHLTAVTTGCCIANLLMNAYLLPRIGLVGAAWATLFSYLLMVAILAVISRRYLYIRIPVGALVSAVILVVAIQHVMGIGSFSSPWLNLLAKAPASVALFVVGMWLMRPKLRRWGMSRWQRQFAISRSLTATEP